MSDPIPPSSDHDAETSDSFVTPSSAPEPTPGLAPGGRLTQVGPYRIVRSIATGGMGTVYLAEQEQPRRPVALKVIRAGIATSAARRRFDYESEVLARLRHPHVAQVYEAGTTEDGVPFFAMEYVPDARTLTEWADAEAADPRERIGLFIRVCAAIHHGHQKGVIHRDLKPGNILVDADGAPKIIDFGVARSIEPEPVLETVQTTTGQLVGTLPYMSPEQCGGDPADLDIRSDVYALGVVLYELLAGRLPYDLERRPLHEITRVIREVPPTRLSTRDRALAGDVETICLKALEKSRDRRYSSAHELAEDLRRYLDHEPILARPPSVTYQLGKFARRHRVLVAGAAAVLVVLVLGIVGTSFGLLRAEAARAEEQLARRAAEREEKRASREARIAEEVNRFLNDDLLAAVAPEQLGREVSMRDVLDAAADRIEGRFPAEPEVEAALRRTLGVTYLRLGEYELARPHLERAVSLYAVLPDAEAARARAQTSLGSFHRYAGDYEQAEERLRAALAWQRGNLGPEHPETLATMNELAVVHRHQGRYDEAEPLYLAVLAAQERRRDAEPGMDADATDDVVTTLQNLAILLQHQGRYEEAEPRYLRALEMVEASRGPEHRFALKVANNVAYFYSATGRYDDALPILERTLERSRRVLDDDHPDTLLCMNSLAVLLTRMGRDEDAEPLYEVTLATQVRRLGADHPDALRTMGNLAFLCARIGRDERAEELFAEALERRIAASGPEHRDTLVLCSNYGDFLAKRQRLAEAEPLLRQAADGGRRALGEHWYTGVFLTKHGSCLLEMDRPEDAQRALAEALAVLEATRGADDARTATARDLLARARAAADPGAALGP